MPVVMSPRYRLPCSCGQYVEIDERQAGLSVTCDCGKTLEAPSIRQMRRLELVTVAAARRDWHPRWGLLIAGAAFLVVGIAWGVISQRTPRTTPFTDLAGLPDNERAQYAATPERLLPDFTLLPEYGMWMRLRDREPDFLPQELNMATLRATIAAEDARRRQRWPAFGAGVLGALLLAAGIAAGRAARMERFAKSPSR